MLEVNKDESFKGWEHFLSFRVSDTTFNELGKPGVIVGKDPVTATLKVDTNKDVVAKNSRHGYINGMEIGQKRDFNAIMDKMRSIEDRREQVGFLRDRLDEIKNDPKQVSLTQYLKAELAHLMQTYNLQTRFYEIEEHKLPNS